MTGPELIRVANRVFRIPCSIDRLRSTFSYDPETGQITKRGLPVHCWEQSGYLRITVAGHATLMHRVAWALMTGEWPTQFIDHRDRCRSNNRWSNLRQVTNAVNLQNSRPDRVNNTSGFVGVRRQSKSDRWRATIKANGQRFFLGTFDTPEEASAAYRSAKLQLHTSPEA